MDAERRSAISRRLRNLVEKFRDKAYRDSYIAGHTRRFLAHQMRRFRGDLSQEQFGDVIGKQQTVVSRLEDPNYGKWTLQTLFDTAAKLNLAVVVRFVDVPTFLRLTENMSGDASMPQSYSDAQMDSMLEPPTRNIIVEPSLSFDPHGAKPIKIIRLDDNGDLGEIASTDGCANNPPIVHLSAAVH